MQNGKLRCETPGSRTRNNYNVNKLCKLISTHKPDPNIRQINQRVWSIIWLRWFSRNDNARWCSAFLSHGLGTQSFFHRRSRIPERVHYLRMLWETVYRSKSECTASTEIVMPCFTFHATEGAPSPNTAGIIHRRKRNKLSLDRQLFLFRTRPRCSCIQAPLQLRANVDSHDAIVHLWD